MIPNTTSSSRKEALSGFSAIPPPPNPLHLLSSLCKKLGPRVSDKSVFTMLVESERSIGPVLEWVASKGDTKILEFLPELLEIAVDTGMSTYFSLLIFIFLACYMLLDPFSRLTRVPDELLPPLLRQYLPDTLPDGINNYNRLDSEISAALTTLIGTRSHQPQSSLTEWVGFFNDATACALLSRTP